MLRGRTMGLLSAAALSANRSVPSQSEDPPGSAASQPMEEIPVLLKPSRSGRRKSSFYFPRMRETVSHPTAFRVDELGTALPLFAITSSSCEYYALRLPLLKAGFKRLPLVGGDVPTACNVVWGKSPRYAPRTGSHTPSSGGRVVYTYTPAARPTAGPPGQPSTSALTMGAAPGTITLNHPFQRFNHFPGSHKNLGCKRGMAKNIMHAEGAIAALAASDKVQLPQRALAQRMYAFSPRTWSFPEEKEEMLRAFRAAPPTSHFIWKPARGSCGRGILLSQGGERHAHTWESVMREIEAKASHEGYGRVYRHYVVQEYIEKPLLLEGRKMDLRLYVTVTSYNPLTVYLHEEGLVRLAAEPYHSGALDTSCSVVAHEDPQTEFSLGPDPSTSGQATARPAAADALLGGATSQNRRASASSDLAAAARFRHLTNFSVGRRYQAYKQSQQQHESEENGRTPTMLAQSSESDQSTLSSAYGPATTGDHTNCAAADVADHHSPAAESGPELKWSLQRLWSYLDSSYPLPSRPPSPAQYPSQGVKEKIALLVTRTLLAARPNMCKAAAQVEAKCGYFELYGFDVMLDENLDAHLIEINTLPSLESSSDFDYATKCNVISDMLNLAMIEPFARERATLEAFTTSPALLQAPPSHLKDDVRRVGEVSVALSALAPEEQAAEIKARLQDELLYARGFKRIFPPLPAGQQQNNADYPLTCDAQSVLDELSAYSSLGMLTQLDEYALQ